ncbi:MAG: glycosyltransferase family 4 protein [Planctomycetota bacterium]
MKRLIAALGGYFKERARALAFWLAPAGSRRQLYRFRSTRTVRKMFLPRRPRHAPPLPDFEDPDATRRYLANFALTPPDDAQPTSAVIFHWIDFHPQALALFPLATTPAERDRFIAWLLRHRLRFGLRVGDLLAFARELRDDPSCGIEALYRRNPEWQREAPGGLTAAGWPGLQEFLARRYVLREPWLTAATPPRTAETPAQGVNLLAHFCYPCGLQAAAMNTLAALEDAGWNVSCRDVPNRAATDLPGRQAWLGLHPYPITLVQLAPNRLGRNAYELAGLQERPGVYRIGYWYWELETAPAAWARQSDWLDEIWAPTRFIGDALRRIMTIPVIDMLPGLAPPSVAKLSRAQLGLPEDRFLFLFAFDMSSTGERKNPEAVVAAFQRAFEPDAPVALAIKIRRGWEEPQRTAALHAAAQLGRIIILDESLPEDAYFGLLNCCDAYISLHRSEGLGMTLAEAMALGKPTIATRYSGNLDFMNDDNSLLVAATMTSLRTRTRSYPRGARWAEPSIEDAAAKMRWVVENPVAARQLAERGRLAIQGSLSLADAGRRMTKRLAEIEELLGRKQRKAESDLGADDFL